MTAMRSEFSTTQKRRPAPQVARHGFGPKFWMHEQGGRLEPAIWALLEGDQLSDDQIPLVRAYLRQWIDALVWQGPAIDELRRGVDGLTTTEAIRRWLGDALRMGIDPL
jgi:hypothetical protein